MRARSAYVMLVAAVAACSRREPAPLQAVADAGQKLSHVRVEPSLLSAGRIQVGVASKRALGDVRVFPGEVVSDEQGRAEAGTLVAGRVASLEVGVGTAVRRGQVLAWLDAPEAARVAADIIRARARAEVSSRKEERQRELAKEQATSKNAVDDAFAEARIARADLAAARSLLKSLGGTDPATPADGSEPAPLTSRVAVRSPIDGVVTKRMAVLGGAVAPENALFEVTTKGRVVALVRIPELVTDAPPSGSPVTIHPRGSSGGPNATCAGSVQGDLGTVDPETRTRALRAEPTGACVFMVAGAFVSVELAGLHAGGGDAGGGEAVLSVPRDAVIDMKGAKIVFVADAEPGAFALRTVRLGPESGDFVSVEDGLREGERIAIVGAPLLKGELLRAELYE